MRILLATLCTWSSALGAYFEHSGKQALRHADTVTLPPFAMQVWLVFAHCSMHANSAASSARPSSVWAWLTELPPLANCVVTEPSHRTVILSPSGLVPL